jgi:hypothetical protein
MSSPHDEEVVRDYYRMQNRAYAEHDPTLEPYASMPVERLCELWAEANQADDIPRSMMLEQFVHDKLTPREFLVMMMAQKLMHWFLLEYADEYAVALNKGGLEKSAATLAATMIDANREYADPDEEWELER